MIDRDYIAALKLTAQTNFTMGQALLKVAEQMEREIGESKWVSLDTAAVALGDISERMLKERCIDGRFTHGKEFIDTSDGNRPNYMINVSAARKYFQTDPAKRPPPRKAG